MARYAEPGAHTRREFMLRTARAAGVAPLAFAVLDGSARALPRNSGTDLEYLSAALALEHHAIAVYRLGQERKLFPAGLRRYAAEFRGDHEGHRDTQIVLVKERGGTPPEALASYDLGALNTGDQLLRQAYLVERAAQDAYIALISQIRTNDYLLAAGFILVDEVRHLTVWQRVLGHALY